MSEHSFGLLTLSVLDPIHAPRSLTQEDFRKLLSTPRPGGSQTPSLGALGKRPPKPTTSSSREDDGFAKPEVPKHKRKPFRKQDRESDGSDDVNRYRDRARERRKGVNPDYKESEQILATLSASNVEATPAGIVPESKNLSYEQSKYLGGDIKHTHLVKGLDFALLQKVRSELDSEEDKTESDARAYVEALHGSDEAPAFRTKLAEKIYDEVVKKKKEKLPLRNEMFVAGRLSFSWDLGIDAETGEILGSSDIPTTVLRSKAEIMDYESKLNVSSSDIVIEKITQIMSYLRQGTRGSGNPTEKKRIKKKEKERLKQEAEQKKKEQESKAMLEDEDEDIFADAGRDYVLEVKDKKTGAGIKIEEEDDAMDLDVSDTETPTTKAATKVESSARPSSMSAVADLLKDNDEDSVKVTTEDILKQSAGMLNQMQGAGAAERLLREMGGGGESSAAAGPSRPPTSAALASSSSSSTSAPSSSSSSTTRLQKLQALESVDYADMADMADIDVSGSDDEGEDLSQMDLGTRQNKRRQLTRFDFDTEEEWQQYKDTQVHLPKAAFQFGVKASDGRNRMEEGAGRKGKKDWKAKLNKEMVQIDRLMSEKYGAGIKGKEGNGGKKKYEGEEEARKKPRR
ncbi:hypothetical protein HK102_002269 [Quaeritorhiza haematococci]|nr:hypothetical protein HK102_002269 [Quaeritorhiza haematococci]